MTAAHNRGKGVSCQFRTERHQVHRWGKWWVSEEEAEKYIAREKLRGLRHRRGFKGTLEEFKVVEAQSQKRIEILQAQDRRLKVLKTRVVEKHGLVPNATRFHLKGVYQRTGDPEVLTVLQLMAERRMTDADRIQEIRKAFMSGNPPLDILIKVAHLVGVDLRRKM